VFMLAVVMRPRLPMIRAAHRRPDHRGLCR
jgi:hypothetical protein